MFPNCPICRRCATFSSALFVIIVTSLFMSCTPKANIVEETLRFVENEKIDIQGKELPSGKVYSLKECFARNRYLERTIHDMVMIAHRTIRERKLEHTVFILNTTGRTRDDYGIGFDYPQDPEVAKFMSMTAKAKAVIEWANNLPPGEREQYLQRWRDSGWKGFL